MKKKTLSLILMLLCIVSVLALASCTEKTVDADGLWANAAYLQDTELGTGSKTVEVEVKAGERSVLFTIHTDGKTVGDALTENGLISGDQGDFGLYVKVVNGITADYDVDQSYWSFNVGDEMAMTGVDGTEIAEGVRYSLVYTK